MFNISSYSILFNIERRLNRIFQKYNSRKVTQMTKNGNARTVYVGSNKSLLSKSGNLTSFSHYTSPIHLHPPLFFLSKFSSAHQTVKYRLAISRLFHQQPSTNQRLGYSNEIISQFLVLSASMSELLIARKINSLDEVVKASKIGKKKKFHN